MKKLFLSIYLTIAVAVFTFMPMLAYAGPVSDVADQIGQGIFKFVFAIAAGLFIIYKIGTFLFSLFGIGDNAATLGATCMSVVITIVGYLLWTPMWEGIAGFTSSIGL